MAEYMKKSTVIKVIENHGEAVCDSGYLNGQDLHARFMVDAYRLAHKHLAELFEAYSADGVIDIPTSAWFTTEKEGVFRCLSCSSEFKIPCIDGKPIWRGCPICLARMVEISQ